MTRARKKSRAVIGPSPSILSLTGRREEHLMASGRLETGTGFASREAVRGPFLPSRCSRRQDDGREADASEVIARRRSAAQSTDQNHWVQGSPLPTVVISLCHNAVMTSLSSPFQIHSPSIGPPDQIRLITPCVPRSHRASDRPARPRRTGGSDGRDRGISTIQNLANSNLEHRLFISQYDVERCGGSPSCYCCDNKTLYGAYFIS